MRDLFESCEDTEPVSGGSAGDRYVVPLHHAGGVSRLVGFGPLQCPPGAGPVTPCIAVPWTHAYVRVHAAALWGVVVTNQTGRLLWPSRKRSGAPCEGGSEVRQLPVETLTL